MILHVQTDVLIDYPVEFGNEQPGSVKCSIRGAFARH